MGILIVYSIVQFIEKIFALDVNFSMGIRSFLGVLGIIFVGMTFVFWIIHIILKADIEQYELNDDFAKVYKNVYVMVEAFLICMSAVSEFTLKWYMFIPICLDLIFVFVLYPEQYSWKHSIKYAIIFSIINARQALVIVAIIKLVNKFTIVGSIFIIVMFNLITMIISKIYKS